MKFKLFVITLLSLSLLGSTLVIGNDLMEKIEARLDGALNFNVDGEVWYPEDVDGSPLIPIVFNNRTYIPVRALLEHKGAGVDYEADTRTVVLDFTKIETTYTPQKELDKSTPLLIGRSTDSTTKETTLNFSRNPYFVSNDLAGDMLETVLTYSYDLNDDSMIEVDGKMIGIDEFLRLEEPWKIETGGDINLSYNAETDKAIKSLSITTHGDHTDENEEMASKIDVEIEISGPPFKLKITIKF